MTNRQSSCSSLLWKSSRATEESRRSDVTSAVVSSRSERSAILPTPSSARVVNFEILSEASEPDYSCKWHRSGQLDEDTVRLLEIAQHFLVRYFGHDEGEAERLMGEFVETSAWDQDVMHHESSYRVAAAAHYLCALGGDRSALGTWLLEEGHNRPPRDALEYFRRHYFGQRAPGGAT